MFSHASMSRSQVKPKAGRVGPHTTTLVALRFCPSAAQQYTRQLHCSINHNLKAAVPLQLIGAGYTPAIHFETPGSTMFFKPTCVGATSVRPLVVRNPSSIPVLFYWTIPRALKDVVGLSPMAGKIPGKGALEIQASFRPQKIKTYTSQAVCRIRGARDRESDAILANALAGIELEASSFDHALPLTIVGEGSNGAVTVSQMPARARSPACLLKLSPSCLTLRPSIPDAPVAASASRSTRRPWTWALSWPERW